MYRRVNDVEVFRKFWENDANVKTLYFQIGTQANATSLEDFLDYCHECDRVYLINDVALLYVQRVGANANVHLSLLKGNKVAVEDFIPVRDEMLQDFDMIFGWCNPKNLGLKRLLEGCGLKYKGFSMLRGWHRTRALEWYCFSLSKEEVIC